jgi:hypothetical protein
VTSLGSLANFSRNRPASQGSTATISVGRA